MARTLVIEADGGSRGNPGQSGSGAVVIDSVTGEILAEIGLQRGWSVRVCGHEMLLNM